MVKINIINHYTNTDNRQTNQLK